jgi:Ran GTPase-activating protein (RanGAP) involved in mRNA processing and transport
MSDRLSFLAFCAKVRNNDPSVLPEPGQPLRIRPLSKRKGIELADSLLESSSVTFLQLESKRYTKNSAEAMAKYVRTSKRLQRLGLCMSGVSLQHRGEEIICCFLHAIQDSTSLKELCMELSSIGGPSCLVLENMLAHTQSLRSLKVVFPAGPPEDMAVAALRSGLKKNTTLRELTLVYPPRDTTSLSPILTSLRDHPLLQRLCLCGFAVDLTGLETVLLCDNSKITELEIDRFYGGPGPLTGLTRVLQALTRRPTLTKLILNGARIGRDEARQLGIVLCNISSLQSLVLANGTLGSTEFAELAPALYHNTSIKVLDMSNNNLDDIESARLLRDILRHNKSITTLDLSVPSFGRIVGAADCIAEGLSSNSTLLKVNFSHCAFGNDGVSTLAQNLGSRNTTLQKLKLDDNSVTSTGVGVLLETMEQSSHNITDLDLRSNSIGKKGASLIATALANNVLPNLTCLSLYGCCIGNDGFIALVSALEQNTSLLQLDLRSNDVSERAFSALAESLPEIKVLQRVDLRWCTDLASAMPLLLEGLHKNKSLFHFHVAYCTPSSVPPTPTEAAICAGGWMQEMERLGYRNRFLPLIRAPIERLPPRGVWSRALAGAATLPDVIFEVLCSKPSLVPSEDTEGMEAATDTGVPNKRKRGDE